MFQHKLTDNINNSTLVHWFVLSLLAGNINAGGFLSCQRFVSHITGFATLTGIFVEKKEWVEALGTLIIPVFFLIGVVVSGYLTEKKYQNNLKKDKYAPVMGLVSILLFFVSIAGYYNFFGDFGSPAKMGVDFILLACLCMACGLQNSAITSASGSTLRTTHLTGLTTDIGLSLVRQHSQDIEANALEKRINYIRISILVAFTIGSVIGAYTYVEYKYLGFLLPSVLSLYLAFLSKK